MVHFLSVIIGLLIMAMPVACMWFYKRGREDEREHRPPPSED
jgi:heme/copper-type cytochrome/quinol oxidase subunit 2